MFFRPAWKIYLNIKGESSIMAESRGCIFRPGPRSGRSAVGSAPALGAGCRAFESHRSDQKTTVTVKVTVVFASVIENIYGYTS